jgi:hypothetical protein
MSNALESIVIKKGTANLAAAPSRQVKRACDSGGEAAAAVHAAKHARAEGPRYKVCIESNVTGPPSITVDGILYVPAADQDTLTLPAAAAAAAATTAKSRTKGCTALATRHTKPVDSEMTFDEDSHSYTYKGKRFKGKSMTGLIHDLFGGEPFDADVVIGRCLSGWSKKYLEGKPTEYPDILQRLLVRDIDTHEATELIKAEWKMSNVRGTAAHACLETHMDLYGDDWREHSFVGPHTAPYSDGIVPDLKQLDMWRTSTDSNHLVPIRTELCTVALNDKDEPVLVGQCDVWMQNTLTKEYVGVDLKRVKGKYALNESEKPIGYPRTAESPFLKGIPNTKFYQYSAQIAGYAEMIATSHGWDVGNNMYILRVHGKDRTTYQWSKCAPLRSHMRAVIESLRVRE